VVKQAFNAPLDVPGGDFNEARLLLPGRNKDPRLGQEDPQKCEKTHNVVYMPATLVRSVLVLLPGRDEVHLLTCRERTIYTTVQYS